MRVLPLLMATLVVNVLPIVTATSSVTLSLDGGYDSNLLNTPVNNENLSDSVLSASLAAQNLWLLKPRVGLVAALQGSYRRPVEYDALARAEMGGSFSVMVQPSQGFLAGWYRVSVAGNYHWQAFENFRSNQKSISLARFQHLTDKITWSATISAQDQMYSRQPVLDGSRFDAGMAVAWRASPRWLISAQFSAGEGDFASSYFGSLSRWVPADPVNDDWFWDDDLYALTGDEWYTYRLRSPFINTQLGGNVRLSQALALDVDYRYWRMSGAELVYDRHIWRAGLIYRWSNLF